MAIELEKAKIIIRHKLSYNDLPPEMTDEELAPLVQRLRDGDQGVKDTLILAHMRVAFRIAGGMKRRLGVQIGMSVDDIYQAGYFGVVYGVNNQRLTDNNLTAYLTVIIRRFCYDHIEHDKSVPIERRALPKYLATFGSAGSVPLSDSGSESTIEAGIVMQETLSMFQEREQRIIHMMLASYTQTEIAKKLQISQPAVAKVVKTIREKAIRLRILGAWINEITNEAADANPA